MIKGEKEFNGPKNNPITIKQVSLIKFINKKLNKNYEWKHMTSSEAYKIIGDNINEAEMISINESKDDTYENFRKRNPDLSEETCLRIFGKVQTYHKKIL